MIYITSDLHFNHDKSFIYQPRGFSSVEEMNNQIIKNWNEIITGNDEVYILGDLMLGDTDKGIELFNQLNGIKHLIKGNHDSKLLKNRDIQIANRMDEFYTNLKQPC